MQPPPRTGGGEAGRRERSPASSSWLQPSDVRDAVTSLADGGFETTIYTPSDDAAPPSLAPALVALSHPGVAAVVNTLVGETLKSVAKTADSSPLPTEFSVSADTARHMVCSTGSGGRAHSVHGAEAVDWSAQAAKKFNAPGFDSGQDWLNGPCCHRPKGWQRGRSTFCPGSAQPAGHHELFVGGVAPHGQNPSHVFVGVESAATAARRTKTSNIKLNKYEKELVARVI